MVILETKKLSKDFGGLRALDNVDLVVNQGEIFGLIGPNGSGKTTALSVISGFLKPTTGEITFKGRPITRFEPHQIAKKGLIRTFQFTSVFSDLTVKDNIIRGMNLYLTNHILGSLFQSKGYRNEEAKLSNEVINILSFVKLQGKSEMLARNLPAAEQKTLAIAIAMAAKPELLMLDEPVSGMTPQEVAEQMKLIRSIQQNGTSVLIIEHNMKVIMGLCSRIMVLNQGSKIAEGTPEEVSKNEDVILAYLGKRGIYAQN